jgi:hypothetical protein
MRELLRTEQDAKTIARRGLSADCLLLSIFLMFYIYCSASVFLGIAEDELGHQLESLEQLFAQAQEVTCAVIVLIAPAHFRHM